MLRRLLIWYWSGGGGGSQFAAHLAKRLTLQFGADAIALSLRADDPTLKRAQREGVRTLAAAVVSDRRRPLASLGGLARSARILAQHARGADAVIIPMNFALAAPLSAALKQPIVYCAHDPAPHPGDYAAIAQRMTQSLLLRRARDVVALSEHVAAQLRGRGIAAKLRLAPLSSVFPPRATAMRAGTPTRLLFCGRMIAYKGVGLLADALERLASRRDWRLTLAGAGPALTEAMRARYAALGAEVRPAWLREDEIDSLMRAHDIVLAPYLEASQSGVVADALCRGRPCIVTPVGALPEQIGGDRAGWAAKSPKAEHLADILDAALSDPSGRVKKGEAAAALAEAAYRDDEAWAWLQR